MSDKPAEVQVTEPVDEPFIQATLEEPPMVVEPEVVEPVKPVEPEVDKSEPFVAETTKESS